jgi:hypothetical protein
MTNYLPYGAPEPGTPGTPGASETPASRVHTLRIFNAVFSVTMLFPAIIVTTIAALFPAALGASVTLPYTPTVLFFLPLAAVALHHIINSTGYRPAPLDKSLARTEASAQALHRVQRATSLRALAGMGFIVVTNVYGSMSDSTATLVLGSLMGVALVLWHAFPRRSSIMRCEEALDSQLGRSYLSEMYGLTAWTGSDDQRPFATPQPR